MSQVEPRPFSNVSSTNFKFDAPGDVVGSLHAGRVKADAIREKEAKPSFIVSGVIDRVKTEIYFLRRSKDGSINI